MVTTQYLGELRVVYNPVQWQQGNKQSHQNFHQLKSRASIASTGYQHPKPRDGACRPCSNQHQISRKVDAYCNTSAYSCAQHSGYCGTSANENSVIRSIHHSGRQTDCSKRRKVNTNIDTGLQLRQKLSCARSVCTSSAVLQGNGLGYSAQTIPLQDQHSPMHLKKLEERKSSLAALNCGKAITQTIDLSAETDSTVPCQQRLITPPLSSESVRDEVLPFRKMVLPTDDQIEALITQYVTDYREIQKMNGRACPNKEGSLRTNGRDSTRHSDNIMPKSNSLAHCPTTSSNKEDEKKQSLNHDVTEQRSAVVGQALEEDSSAGTKANAEITLKFKDTGDCTFAREKHSKATLASVGNSKHAPKTKSFEKSVSVDFNLTVKTHQSATGDHKVVYSGDSEDKTFLDGNCHDKFLQHGRTSPYYSLIPLKEQIASHESRDPIAHMDNFPKVILQQYWNGDIDNINLFISTESRGIVENDAATCTKKEDKSPVVLSCEMNLGQTEKPSSLKSVEDQQHCSATCKEGFRDSRPILKLLTHDVEFVVSTNQSEQLSNKTSHESAMNDVGSVYAQTDASIALSECTVREQSPLCEDGKVSFLRIKDSRYEDISDDEDISPLATEVPNTDHVKPTGNLTFSEYEDISEDENAQIENMAVVEDETDDEMDDDLIVIPISVSDIRFEPEEDALSDAGTGDKDKQCDEIPTYCELPVSASSPLEVFETIESFRQAKGLQFINGFELGSSSSTPKDGLERECTPQRGDLNSEPEDSCDTEDSCDYSPTTERFYLSSQLLKRSAHLSSETLDSVSEKGSEDDEVGHKTNRQKISETVDVILIDSDTEDESDQNRSKKAKTTRLSSSGLDDGREESYCQGKRCSSGTVTDKFKKQGLPDPVIVLDSDSEDDNDQSDQKAIRVSSGSDDDCNALSVQHERHSLETVDSNHGTAKEKPGKGSRLSCGESSFSKHQSKLHNAQFKEVMQDARNDLSHKTGPLIGAEGSSEDVQHKTHRQTSGKRKAKTKRALSSGSEDSDDASFPPKNRRSPEIADKRCGTAKKKKKKPSLSSQDSSKKRPRSVDKNPDPMIAHQNSPSKENLKLSRDSRVSMHGNDETRASKAPTGICKKTDSCKTNTQHPHVKKKVRFASVPIPASENSREGPRDKDAANKAKPRLCSRQLSLPSQVSPSTSNDRSSFASGQLSEANRRDVSSRGLSQPGEPSTSLPKSKQSTAIPKQSSSSSSSQQMSRSNSNCSTSDYPKTPSEGPSTSATVQSSRAQVLKSWQNSYYPTRKDRKSNTGAGEDLRTANCNFHREARPRSRRRHNSHESAVPAIRRQNSHDSETPLMKKTKIDAMQWTWARNREAPRKERHSVGEGYKWSEKPSRFKPTKGSRS